MLLLRGDPESYFKYFKTGQNLFEKRYVLILDEHIFALYIQVKASAISKFSRYTIFIFVYKATNIFDNIFILTDLKH